MNNKIKELRARFDFTQEKLAKEAGVSRQTINAIENEKFSPSLELAFKLSEIFKTRIDEIFIYKEITYEPHFHPRRHGYL